MRAVAALVTSFALALMCAACAQDDQPQPPPLPDHPHDLVLSDASVIGCYEIVSLDWSRPLAGPDGRFQSPPPRFALRPEGIAQDDNFPGFVRWQLIDSHRLSVAWSTGFVGVELVVRQRSTDKRFYGTARPFSDAGPPLNRGRIVFQRVSCSTRRSRESPRDGWSSGIA